MTTEDSKGYRKQYRQWFHICGSLHAAVVNFYAKDSDSIASEPDKRLLKDNVALHEATAIGSKVQRTLPGLSEMHQIMLDLDSPHVYVASTTEGHAHLIFRKNVTWAEYVDFLDACVRVGILELGYRDAAYSRGETWLRVPWRGKGENTTMISDGEGGWKI